MKTAVLEDKLVDGTVKTTEVPLPTPVGTYMIVKMDEDLALMGLKSKDSQIALLQELEDRAVAGNIVGRIIDMGPDCFNTSRFKAMYGEKGWDIGKGDKVIFKMSSGSSVPGTKGRYQFLDDQNIIGVYK